jgi:hypothetical protein
MFTSLQVRARTGREFAPRGRWMRLLVLGCLLLAGGAGEAAAAFPWSPHYPAHDSPSVLDGPRGYGPTPVYGFAGPSYRWGWFGAQYRPRVVHYTGYTGDYWQTGYRWGY